MPIVGMILHIGNDIFAAMETEALQYQQLICTIFQDDDTALNGGDADIYRQMDYAFDILSDNHWGNRVADKEESFRNKFTTVKIYVAQALKEGANKIYYTAAPGETEILDDYIHELKAAGFFDKHRMDSIITDALQLFKDNGL